MIIFSDFHLVAANQKYNEADFKMKLAILKK
jgi:hypothetical protein